MFKEGASGQSRVNAYTYGHEAEDFWNIRIVDDGVSHISQIVNDFYGNDEEDALDFHR